VTETKRLFFAVNVPESISSEIFSKISSKLPSGELKIIPEKNLHFTLLFIGNWSSEKANEIIEKGKTAEGKEFEIELNGIGKFHDRILWIGVKEGENELKQIAVQLEKAVGLGEEKFSPHITIARNKRMKKEEFAKLAEGLSKIPFSQKFTAKSFELMESELLEKGAEYKKVFSFGLNR